MNDDKKTSEAPEVPPEALGRPAPPPMLTGAASLLPQKPALPTPPAGAVMLCSDGRTWADRDAALQLLRQEALRAKRKQANTHNLEVAGTYAREAVLHEVYELLDRDKVGEICKRFNTGNGSWFAIKDIAHKPIMPQGHGDRAGGDDATVDLDW